MIRHLTLALTAALFCSVAHAQQGNLPAPVQKLSPYPPVVCVTPDWRPEPCEDRNASGWQCGNVKVTVSSKGNWSEGDWSTEYLVTGIEKSNNRFTLRPKDELYLNGKLCTPFGEFGKTKPQAPPATMQLPEPVKCLKPDGTEEPCENRHTAQPLTPEERYRAWRGEEPRQDRPPSIPQESCRQIDNCAPVEPEYQPSGLSRLQSTFASHPGIKVSPTMPLTVTVFVDRGGPLSAHDTSWYTAAGHGAVVRVLGLCGSACTLVTVRIPKDRLCFGERASLAFHHVRKSYTDDTPALEHTKWMIDRYPADIRGWIVAHGGLERMPSGDRYWTLPAKELWEMGYRKCND